MCLRKWVSTPPWWHGIKLALSAPMLYGNDIDNFVLWSMKYHRSKVHIQYDMFHEIHCKLWNVKLFWSWDTVSTVLLLDKMWALADKHWKVCPPINIKRWNLLDSCILLRLSLRHATFCLTWLQLFSFNFSHVTADHKLYGRARCWTGLIWNCVSGDTLTANHESSIMIADIVVACKDYR